MEVLGIKIVNPLRRETPRLGGHLTAAERAALDPKSKPIDPSANPVADLAAAKITQMEALLAKSKLAQGSSAETDVVKGSH